MIGLFHRRAVITVEDDRQLFRLHGVLTQAGIDSRVSTRGVFSPSINRGAGISGLTAEQYRYTLLVDREDYARAKALIAAQMDEEQKERET